MLEKFSTQKKQSKMHPRIRKMSRTMSRRVKHRSILFFFFFSRRTWPINGDNKMARLKKSVHASVREWQKFGEKWRALGSWIRRMPQRVVRSANIESACLLFPLQPAGSSTNGRSTKKKKKTMEPEPCVIIDSRSGHFFSSKFPAR